MTDYTLAVGTHDPHGFAAASDSDAIRYAVGFIETLYTNDLERNPQDVVTLLGSAGLVTRPSERLDEFIQRLPGKHPGVDPQTFQPGDTNIPDCNGD